MFLNVDAQAIITDKYEMRLNVFDYMIMRIWVRTHRTRQKNRRDILSDKILFSCTPKLPGVLYVFGTSTDPNIKQHTMTLNE